MPKPRRQAATSAATATTAAASRSMLVVAGDWLLNVHLKRFDPPPTPQQLMRILRNPRLLAEAVRQASTSSPTKVYEPLPVANSPQARTRECLAIIDEAVRSAPVVGIPIPTVLELLTSRLDHSITRNGLRTMIARNYPVHQLRHFNGNICLRADITIMQIARSRREQQARERVKQLRVLEVA
jgi:hypothetical protein